MYPRPFTYHRPTSLDEAKQLMARHADDVSAYAGGTELLLAMKMHFADYENLVDLKRISELRKIECDGDTLSIGALATHAKIADDSTVKKHLPALAELCGSIANSRVRNAGTIGGNLCFAEPRADPPVLFSALHANLRLASARGERSVPAGDYIIGALETVRLPDELLLAIEIPIKNRSVHYERIVQGHRTIAGAAVVLAQDGDNDPCVWLGCVSTRPVALSEVERVLAERPATTDELVLQTVSAEIASLDIADDEDAHADYRRHLAETVTIRAIRTALAS